MEGAVLLVHGLHLVAPPSWQEAPVTLCKAEATGKIVCELQNGICEDERRNEQIETSEPTRERLTGG